MLRNIKIKPALTAFLIGLVVFGLLALGAYSKNNNADDNNAESNVLSAETQAIIVTVEIDENTISTYDISFIENESVYTLLTRLKSQNSNFSVDFQEYDFNGVKSYFITSMNGVTPDLSKSFWKFQVNGNDSPVGIGDYIIQNGDSVNFLIDDIIF